jgi:hypothetical protein
MDLKMVEPRIYENLLLDHFRNHRQMAFLSGPRQVGKTTLCKALMTRATHATYLNWDIPKDRTAILGGTSAIAEQAGLNELRAGQTFVGLDELHKFEGWKNMLKGLFDAYGEHTQILVTGSGNLETFRSGGESLMGRYLPYRMHPLSVAELNGPHLQGELIRPPEKPEVWEELLELGGFPEPLFKGDKAFHRRWSKLRSQQLVHEDVRSLTDIKELDRLEVLAELVRQQSGQLMNFSSLSRDLKVSPDTVIRWLATLRSLFYCFEVPPWHKNIARALRKQPKYYLWDWSIVRDSGARNENLVASALLKATHTWTDLGLGDFGLHFIRDKEQNEVDFLVTRDDAPWFLVEVKTSKVRLSPGLLRYHEALGTLHAFQVTFEMDYVDRSAFDGNKPIIVPAKTFLSQLV